MTEKAESSVERVEYRRIVSCENCKGTGVMVTEECINYHRGDYADFYYCCRYCDGEGRKIRVTTKVVVHTFVDGERIVSEKETDRYLSMKGLTIADVYEISKPRY